LTTSQVARMAYTVTQRLIGITEAVVPAGRAAPAVIDLASNALWNVLRLLVRGSM
jgi:hypothetical protein